jgi:CBS domain-containing protein
MVMDTTLTADRGLELTAMDIMHRPFVTIRADATVRELAALLAYYGVAEVGVLAADGELLGTAAAAALFHLAAERSGAPIFRIPREPAFHELTGGNPELVPSSCARVVMQPMFDELVALLDRRVVEEIMAPVTLMFSPAASTSEIAHAMLRANVERAPVVRNGRMIGVVSLTDVLRAVARPGHTRSWEPAEPFGTPMDHRRR